MSWQRGCFRTLPFLLRKRIQRFDSLFNFLNFLVGLLNLPVNIASITLNALLFEPVGIVSQMDGRNELNPLAFIAPVVNPGFMPITFQILVGKFGILLPPNFNVVTIVPVSRINPS